MSLFISRGFSMLDGTNVVGTKCWRRKRFCMSFDCHFLRTLPVGLPNAVVVRLRWEYGGGVVEHTAALFLAFPAFTARHRHIIRLCESLTATLVQNTTCRNRHQLPPTR